MAGDIDIKNRSIEWAKQFENSVLYVLGNHEFYFKRFRNAAELTQCTNTHLLDNEELVMDRVRFPGETLWTDFNLFGPYWADQAKLDAQFIMNDYRVIRYGLDYRKPRPGDTLGMHERTVAFLKESLNQPFDGKTMVITHHAPSPQSVAPEYKNDKLWTGVLNLGLAERRDFPLELRVVEP